MDALRQQAAKAGSAYQEWAALHVRATAGLATAVNILARLPALQDGGHFQALGLGPDVQAEVLGKQLQALNEALAGVHAALAAARDPVRELECAALEAGRRAAGMSLMAATQRRGPEPSAAEVAEALQDAWRMCRDELALKQAAVGLLRLDLPQDDAAAVLACLEAQPNVDAARIQAFLQQMAETAPRKPP